MDININEEPINNVFFLPNHSIIILIVIHPQVSATPTNVVSKYRVLSSCVDYGIHLPLSSKISAGGFDPEPANIIVEKKITASIPTNYYIKVKISPITIAFLYLGPNKSLILTYFAS